VVTVRRFANNTPVPGMRVSLVPEADGGGEVCVLEADWRGLFGALLAEEKLRATLRRKWVSPLHPRRSPSLSSPPAQSPYAHPSVPPG
jgi:hypothetical protein